MCWAGRGRDTGILGAHLNLTHPHVCLLVKGWAAGMRPSGSQMSKQTDKTSMVCSERHVATDVGRSKDRVKKDLAKRFFVSPSRNYSRLDFLGLLVETVTHWRLLKLGVTMLVSDKGWRVY